MDLRMHIDYFFLCVGFVFVKLLDVRAIISIVVYNSWRGFVMQDYEHYSKMMVLKSIGEFIIINQIMKSIGKLIIINQIVKLSLNPH